MSIFLYLFIVLDKEGRKWIDNKLKQISNGSYFPNYLLWSLNIKTPLSLKNKIISNCTDLFIYLLNNPCINQLCDKCTQ